MRRDTKIQFVAVLGLVASLMAAGALMPRIKASASEAQLRYTDSSTNQRIQASAGDQFMLDLAQSVGVLRGIVVNYLWIRADALKEDGKFFEAYHLSKWITQLQPRFAKVWSFHAWNMAYNISVATHTKEERWQWVQDGIRLLREQGIRYNPNDMMLYKELAWIFLHKVSGFTDDAHLYYKQRIADRWHGILGDVPRGYQERMEAMRRVAEAPQRLDRYLANLADDPSKQAEYQNLQALLGDLDDAGFKLDESILRVCANIEAMSTSYLAQLVDFERRILDEDIDPRLQKKYGPVLALHPIYRKPEYAQVWPILLAHVRKRVLMDEYNMDPAYMLRFMEKYGPLDWRSPVAHGLYWAAIGVERGVTRLSQARFDQINTDRLLFHSTQSLKRMGSVNYDFITQEVSWGPDLRFIPHYEATFLIVTERLVAEGPGAARTYTDGYRNFLIDAVREYYQWGEYEKANEYYSKLRTPRFVEEGKEGRFTLPINEFVIRETIDRLTSPSVVRNDILGQLVTGFRRGLARGDRKVFQSNYNNAKNLYDYFDREVGDVQTILTEKDRLAFPKWPQMVSMAFREAMLLDIGSGPITWSQRLALWQAAPDELKVANYDPIMNALASAYEKQSIVPYTMEVAFPPPPGLEQFRARQQQQGQQAGDGTGKLNIERK